MKHPLTSKERRGLVAVAAAALLCIASGFIFRNCGTRRTFPEERLSVTDSVRVGDADSVAERRSGPDSISGKAGRKKARRKTRTREPRKERKYPVRSPLDEPCD